MSVGEASLCERRIPSEHVVVCDQHVGMTVAGQVDEAQVRIVPVETRERSETAERKPVSVNGAFVKAGRWSGEIDQIELSVTSQVDELLAPATLNRVRW